MCSTPRKELLAEGRRWEGAAESRHLLSPLWDAPALCPPVPGCSAHASSSAFATAGSPKISPSPEKTPTDTSAPPGAGAPRVRPTLPAVTFLLLIPKERGSGRIYWNVCLDKCCCRGFTFGFLLHLPKPAYDAMCLPSGEICHIPTLEMFFPS